VWTFVGQILFGCQDGKVRLAQLKTGKSVALYSTGSYAVSITPRQVVNACVTERVLRSGGEPSPRTF
jgi:hypothetical protein